MEIKTALKVGNDVWWIHCSNKVYKGTIMEFSFCEVQGAVYCHIYSPTFKINPNPSVHYTNCFSLKEDAKEAVKWLNDNGKHGMMRCDRCKLNSQPTTT